MMQIYSWYIIGTMKITHCISYGLVTTAAVALLFTIPGEKGLIRAYHLKQELKALNAQNASLRQENYILAQEASLLRENLPYIEHIITKEMNLIRPGDTIVVIKKKKN
jgi:cell division protein FtsB